MDLIKSRTHKTLATKPFPIVQTPFVAPEVLHREDAAGRLADIIALDIVPRLLRLRHAGPPATGVSAASEVEIAELARLVLSPDLQAAAEYIAILRERGLTMEALFVGLLEPAARCLGKMWDNDECDFVDVTLGVGRLQKLLAVFNCNYDLPAIGQKRRIVLTLTPGEQHTFGLAMVAKLLAAADWDVTSVVEPTIESIAGVVVQDWYAVAGITLSSGLRTDELSKTIATIRRQSRNPAIGIMVGGPQFVGHPELVARVGADACAANATTAVILAQKLFDIGAKSNWLNLTP